MKQESIIYSTLDKATRHYIMKHITHPDKEYRGPTPSNKELEEIAKKAEAKAAKKNKNKVK